MHNKKTYSKKNGTKIHTIHNTGTVLEKPANNENHQQIPKKPIKKNNLKVGTRIGQNNQMWRCQICSFTNQLTLQQCNMCKQKRGTKKFKKNK